MSDIKYEKGLSNGSKSFKGFFHWKKIHNKETLEVVVNFRFRPLECIKN